MRRDLISKSVENRKKIERLLATAKRGMTLSEIARELNLPISTVKRHLEKLISIGRVHTESYKGSTYYIWNGEEKYHYKVFLSDNHVLFIDAMVNPWGRPFVRIKESKRIPGTNEWEDVGAIIVDSRKLSEFIEKLKEIEKNLDKYAESGELA